MGEGLVDGKYELIRQLGEGGMGSVHEARHVGTGRKVALKLISPEALQKSPDIGARFEREARAAGHVESRHVAQVLDTGRDVATSRPYLVMELLRGEDLSQLVERVGALTPEIALRITAQALTGLQKAHEAGIVHRDIKPANVFLAAGEGDEIVVKVLDFGIAKVRADPLRAEHRDDVALTRTGSMLGSPLYMSPEQARSAKALDHRCDLWAMGIVMHEALSGRTPYGDVDTIGGLVLEICSGRPRNVQESAPWVTPEIARIVHRALHPDIAMRYQTAQEMLDDVKALLPFGAAVTTASLVPIAPTARAITASPFTTSGISPFARTEGHSPSFSGGTPLPGSFPAAVSTNDAFAQSQSRPQSRLWPVFVGIGAIVLIGAGAIGMKMFTARAAPATSVSPQPPPVVSTSTTETVGASVSVAVTAPVASASTSATTTKVPATKPTIKPTTSTATARPTSSSIQPDRDFP